MNYAKINKYDIANGEGVRVSLFVSGCRYNCPGCFNKEAQNFEYGQKWTEKTSIEILQALEPNYIAGLTLLGGEPLEPENQNLLNQLCNLVKTTFPNKTIWCYTGNIWENVKDFPIMKYIDVLVDGPFIEAKKDLNLLFRGSSNQRIIDVQKSLQTNSIVLYFDLYEKISYN